jgi:oxygen-dependent protoporphyrinogen oxidase
MSRLVEALVERMERVDVRLGHPVREIVAGPREVTVDGETFDHSIITTPAHVAARLVPDAEASDLLRTIEHASAAVVNLVFPPDSLELPDEGSGLLVPSAERRTISGATWVTRKWPAVRPQDGSDIVRCVVGRKGREPVLDLDDEELVDHVVEDLQRLVGVGSEPKLFDVARWDNGMPQYKVGHLRLVQAIDEALPPGVLVAGCDLRGSGLPDCIKQALKAVDRALPTPLG